MLLTPDQEMIRDAVRAFAQAELWPNAARWDRERIFPAEAHRGLAALGAYGVCVPESLGGAGLDYLSLALILEEIAAGDGGLEEKCGQHSSDTTQILLENCRVPGENLIGTEGDGYRIALSALEGGRIGIAAQSIGMARSALEVAIAYAKERQSFGNAIIHHQAVGFRLADCATRLEAARQLTWHAASLRDAGLPCLKAAAMAKLFASETAEAVCSAAMQTLGGYGYVADFPIERIWRDVRVCQIYEGTSDIQRLLIARQL